MLERRNDAFWRPDVKTEQKTLTNIRAAWLTLTDTLWPSSEVVPGPELVARKPTHWNNTDVSLNKEV